MSHRFIDTPIISIAPQKRLSDQFFVRLLQFYNNQPKDYQLSPIWEEMERSVLCLIKLTLGNGDSAGLRNILENLYRSQCVQGFDLSETDRNFVEIWDAKCIGAATAIGVVPVFNPEQPQALELDREKVLTGMEGVLGIRLDWSGGGQMPSMLVGGRNCPMKMFEAIIVYQFCCLENKVLEIGSGLSLSIGLLARSGVNCQIYDLPIVAVMQSYLLACALGEHAVVFSGEHSDGYVLIHGLNERWWEFDIAVNENSFPEIPKTKAYELMQKIEDGLKPTGFFLSINQETGRGGQERVFELVKATSLHLKSRTPYWLRQGYVQEIYSK